MGNSHIRVLPSKYGFRYVWMSQEIGNDVLFIKLFKQRLINCYTKKWNSGVFTIMRNYYTMKNTK